MTNAQSPEVYMGRNAIDTAGDKVGKVEQVYVSDTTGMPDWVTLKTGMFGKDRFAPLYGSSFSGEDLVLPYGKDVVKDSPEVADTEHLDADESDALYRYYQQYLGQAQPQQSGERVQSTENAGNTEGTLTRSEEQLRVGTEQVAAGRAGIRKYVVTEQQTVNVPVSHEEVRVIREPLAPGESVDGATIGEDSIEVPLMAERAVVDKEIVGVEKVRLTTATVTEQQAVTEQVRKEQIEVTGDALKDQPGPK